MQLTNKTNVPGNVRLALAAASMSLLHPVVQAEENTPWQVDSALLVYSEADSRVTAIEPIVALKKDLGDEHIFSVKLTLDSLTGASPNGALPANEVQTFTGPSGKGTYTAEAGELPLDDQFKDTRVAINLNWEQPFGEHNRFSIGGNFSNEYDFKSAALSAAIARDFNNKNTTVSLGVNLESDSIDPVGGTPIPMATMINTLDETDEAEQTAKSGNSESKTVTDALIGITQVMNRHWLMQFNYSYGTSSGYHTDPYKIASVLDDTGALAESPLVPGTRWYLYESRPDTRARHSVFFGNKYHLTEDVIDFSYRYYTDDWGIDSHTLDLRYRYQFAGNMYLEPHLRWYNQTAADFYRLFVSESTETAGGVSTLEYLSADPRLSEFTGTSVGLKYGIEFSRSSEFYIRAEQYTQSYDAKAPASMTNLQGLDLAPDLSAVSVLVGYSFEF